MIPLFVTLLFEADKNDIPSVKMKNFEIFETIYYCD